MPLLSKRIFNCVKPLTDVQPDEKVFTIPHTKEQFRSQDEYEKRLQLYKKRIWTCQSTGHVNLTHEEAWNSEKAVLKTLKEQFAPCYDRPVLELVHHSTKSLDTLVDEAWLMLQQVLVVEERVLLKVKSGGKSMKAVIVKVDPAGCEGNPTSNCNSPSSDKENKDSNSSPKKWVPPKLLPYKYSIRFENEDSVIHSVPACDLSRGDKPPSKELLRLFIRTYAVRAGHTPNSPWVVDDAQVKKLDLQSKFASFLLSPVKWKADEVAKKIDEEVKSLPSPSKGSPRIKTKMDAKEEKRREKAKKSITKIEKKSEKLKQLKEKQSKKTEVVDLDSSDESSDESEAEKETKSEDIVTLSYDSDSDTPLSVVKNQMTPKKEKDNANTDSPGKVKKKKSLADLKKQMEKSKNKESKGKKTMSLADLKKKLEKKKLKKLEKQKDKKLKKGQDPKQMTLMDSLKKKGLKTPEKKSQSPSKQKSPFSKSASDFKKKLMSQAKTPIVIQKLQQAMTKQDKALIGTYATQAAKILTNSQREKLDSSVKELVMKKYNIIQERLKLSKMSEEEKKAYLKQKAQEKREEYKKKRQEIIKKTRKKFEDTELDLTPLPAPTLVTTPDGIPNELFGDIAMVTEFISCYSGLLMPDDEYPIYTDALMKALASGKDGFTYLCRTLTVLLQTLLQDQIAEDYEELRVPLSDIPVNPGTCSELVRLCLRRQDHTDNQSDISDAVEDDSVEVPDELIQLLESQEFHQLEATQKIAILKGLCERIMATYSVQDYMEEKQQESARLWREKLTQWKEKKAEKQKKENERKENEKENENDSQVGEKKAEKEKDSGKEGGNNMLLTHFYGKKDEEGQNSGNSSETPMECDDDDVISTIKRRRVTAAQAQEERRKKELADRLRREKEQEVFKQQKAKEQFEKDFVEGILLAKITQRQMPVGTDRNHSRYWVFCDVTPGVFVEKGWVGDEIEYTCKQETDDDSESSSEEEDDDEDKDGEEAAGTAKKNKPHKVKKCVDKTFPKVGQNLWFTYDKQSVVKDLIQALHPQGSRESCLRKELLKRQADISKAIYRQQRTRELRDCDGDKEMLETFRKELMETELRLRNGGLGGVDDFPSWSTRLETAVDVSTLGDCLLECQAFVLEKFRAGVMVQKKKHTTHATVKEEETEEEEEKVEAPGIQHWRDAVKSAATFSRLHVLLGILDSCIKWEKSAENAKCKICRKKGEDDKLLLCDECNQAFHIYCLRPALPCVPKGEWKCVGCAPVSRKRVYDVPGRYNELDSEDDEDIKAAKTKSLQHDDTCFECQGDENLILCAECPSAYHLECHDPPLRHPPRGRWVCNDCKNGVKRRTRRGAAKQDARKQGLRAPKRKRYDESSEEEEEEEENEEEDDEATEIESGEEDTKPPPRKAARTSKGRGAKRGPKPKRQKSESPREETRSRSRRSAPSPDIVYEKPKASRRAPSELSLMEDIVNKMLDFKSAWPFWNNVSKKDVPDYYDIIKQPISFQKIKDRLNCLVYGSPQEVIDAVALLFRNAVEYNKVGSEVYDCIEVSEKHFVDQLKKYLPFYAYNREGHANGYGDHMYSEEGRRSRKSK